MTHRTWLVGVFALVLGAAACADAGEGARSAEEAAAADPQLEQVPVFPADSGDLDTSGGASPVEGAVGPGGGQIAPGATPETGAGASPSGPAGPAGSSAREGAGPPGGDDLGGDPVRPQSTSQTDAILRRAASAYAAVRTLRADFEQSTENPVLRRTTTSRGTLFQSRPDRFAMRFSQPDGDRIVADGQYIWVYYPSVDDEQVIRMTAGAGGAGAIDLQAQFLGNPVERFNAVHNGTESVGGRQADVLTLTPRGRDNFRSLKVWIDRDDALVRRFEITEHNGVVRRFLLRNLTPGASIDASTFQFTPPEGANVIARG